MSQLCDKIFNFHNNRARKSVHSKLVSSTDGGFVCKCHPNSVLQPVDDHVAQITGIISNSSSPDENRLYNSHQESYLYIQCTNFPFGIIFFSIEAEILTFCIHRKRFLTFPFVLGWRCSGTSDAFLPLCSSHSSDMRSINSGKCSSQGIPQLLESNDFAARPCVVPILLPICRLVLDRRKCGRRRPIENRISLHNRSGEKYFRFCNGIPLKWTLVMIPFTLSHHLLIEREHPRGK